jgi:hypothetical protein
LGCVEKNLFVASLLLRSILTSEGDLPAILEILLMILELELEKLSRIITSYPRDKSSTQVWEPI